MPDALVIPARRLVRRRAPIPRALARRIDALSRRAHLFHRFAHHPLCDEYAGEVIRVGRVRLCRGCTFAIAGGLAGGVVGLLWRDLVAAAVAAAVAVAVLAAAIAVRRLGRARPPKLVTRLAPAALLAYAITVGTLAVSGTGVAVAVVAIAATLAIWLAYRKRGPDRSACPSCADRNSRPCRGFTAIVRRERAFSRLTARWLARDTVRM